MHSQKQMDICPRVLFVYKLFTGNIDKHFWFQKNHQRHFLWLCSLHHTTWDAFVDSLAGEGQWTFFKFNTKWKVELWMKWEMVNVFQFNIASAYIWQITKPFNLYKWDKKEKKYYLWHTTTCVKDIIWWYYNSLRRLLSVSFHQLCASWLFLGIGELISLRKSLPRVNGVLFPLLFILRIS